ncbi:hypothetical protein B0T26DRAFT_697494 [Lasiosphaeria miniovina]|uniref:Secreted protein n=1 Tax=Lasiosphaeria miniovina TaxID=1954250 RepID=A0AA40B5Y6_9PEZI|nr:uncharacterized protein B0T26DRAFT_697494 [Lasiosphaeria miniovina]KAK0728292.1 hypothetical protein B0T26DRAFT_697494 [Lasiosphaeria miniovina]
MTWYGIGKTTYSSLVLSSVLFLLFLPALACLLARPPPARPPSSDSGTGATKLLRIASNNPRPTGGWPTPPLSYLCVRLSWMSE